jgi:hypothetical protein
MRKTAALSLALAFGMTLAGSAHAQGEADTTNQNSASISFGGAASPSPGTSSAAGNYDAARANNDLGTGIMGYHGRRMFGTDNRGAGTGMFGHGNGFLGTNLWDGDHTNNGIFSTRNDGRDGTGFLGTRGTGTGYMDNFRSYSTTTTDNNRMDWGWLGLLGLLGLVGLRGRNDTETRTKI